VKVPITTVEWSQWKTEHPETEVLSRDTGFSRNYGQIKVTNIETGEEIIPIRLFWFAWAAFHPNTESYVK